MKAITSRNPAISRSLVVLIAASTIVRMIFAQTGLGIDETYTVATSRVFSLSYFDHPPLSWWLSWAMQTLFHSDAPFVVRMPFIALSGIATWQMYRLTSLLFGDQAGLFAATAFACAPALGITSGAWVLPDGPLIVGMLGAAICLARLFFVDRTRRDLWLWAGFWAGIALLSKYHGVFIFIGAGLFVLSTKGARHWLATPWPFAGAMLALLVFSPVLIWNFHHQWASFAFQGGRADSFQLHVLKPLATIIGQAMFLLPWTWGIMVVTSIAALRSGPRDGKRWFLLCMGLPTIFLFTLIAAFSGAPKLYHWAMPGYLFLLPLVGEWLSRNYAVHKRAIAGLMAASLAIALILVGGVFLLWYFPLTKITHAKDALIDMRAPYDAQAYLDNHGFAKDGGLIIAPTKWYLAGKFDYALGGRYLVTCLCLDAHQYGINAPMSELVGRNVLVPVPLKDADTALAKLTPSFRNLRRVDNLDVKRGKDVLETFALFYGTGFAGLPVNAE